MHVSRVNLSERNQFVVGLVGLSVTALIVVLSLNVATIRSMLLSTEYTAVFATSGGVRPGDDVRVAGMTVGQVEGVDLAGRHVEVSFGLEDIELGDRSRAAVKSDNALGSKYLDIDPGGEGTVKTIPMARTEKPYDVTTALSDLTANNAQIDVTQLARSFDTLSTTFANTAPALKDALKGVGALSDAISSRDQELQTLLRRANSVTGVLAERNSEIVKILSNGNALLEELNNRRVVIRDLLSNTQLAADQLSALVDDNADKIGPALKELRGVIDVLNRSSDDIEFALQNLSGFIRSLGEAVGGGPFFYAFLQNLAPADLLPILPDLVGAVGGQQ